MMTAWVYNPAASAVTVAAGFSWASGTATVICAPVAWTPVTVVVNCPGGVTSAYQVIGPVASGVTIYITGAVAATQVPGQLLAAQSVAANQIAANTITAAQIAAATITAAQIAANTITAAQIAANTITGAQIVASVALSAPVITGGTITGATIVADGVNGEFLVYSGTPAAGNLVLSVSASAGSDGFGNSYPAGIGLFNSTSAFTTLAASTAGNLQLGTGSSGGGGLEMVSQASSPSSATNIFYADANGSAAYRKGTSGINGQLVVSRTDNTLITNTTAAKIALTVLWSIPASDAVTTTTYRLTCWGTAFYTGTTPSGGIGFDGLISGSPEGSVNIPSSALAAASTEFYWKAEYVILVTNAASNLAQYTLTVWVNNAVQVAASGTPQTFTVGSTNTMGIRGSFATGATTVNLSCYGSAHERMGA
jgi:hypothetical protein